MVALIQGRARSLMFIRGGRLTLEQHTALAMLLSRTTSVQVIIARLTVFVSHDQQEVVVLSCAKKCQNKLYRRAISKF